MPQIWKAADTSPTSPPLQSNTGPTNTDKYRH
jgi:hypothetical protein